MAERDEYDHYIRRANLALAGHERGEQVSTWVLFEHVKESVELIRSLSSENTALKAQVDQLTAWLKQERISGDALTAQLFDILSDKS